MIHIHVFNAVVVLPHESRHANRTFLRVLRVTNGKILKISQQSAFTFCVSLTSHLFFSEKTHTHTLHASSEPVRGGGPTTILPLHVARPWEEAWRLPAGPRDVYRIPMPFLRLGPWRGDHYHSVGAGREADASGARARLSACRGGRRVVQTPEPGILCAGTVPRPGICAGEMTFEGAVCCVTVTD